MERQIEFWDHQLKQRANWLVATIWVAQSFAAVANSTSLDVSSPFASANAQGAVGECNSLYVRPTGFYVHPLYNDIAGRTDKYLTNSFWLGYLGFPKSEFDGSIDMRLSWRFITPGFSSDDGNRWEKIAGGYGDWVEVETAYSVVAAQLSFATIRAQVELGVSHLGPKGAREVQRGLHEELDNAYEHLTWDNQSRGLLGAPAGEINMEFMPHNLAGYTLFSQLSVGMQDDLMMTEIYGKANFVWTFSPSLQIGLETKLSRQLRSALIREDLTPYRHEISLGLRLSEYYQPTFSYVSSYLEKDLGRQLYFDLVNLTIPF